jgi:aminoglycoside phosphotransferase (APT) family kinase protein
MAEPVAIDDLTTALEAALARHFGRPRPVAAIRRAPSAYGSSFALEEMRVEFVDGTSQEVMFKDLSLDGLSAEARAAKPAFLYHPGREIAVYSEVLADARLGTPDCYGAVADPDAGRYWLFLERVSGRELYQVGEPDVWRDAARWLARFHRRFAPRAAALARTVPLVTYDAEFYHRWAARAGAFRRTADHLVRLTAGYDRVVEQLLALPVTLIHGEFYASNVIVQDAADGRRVCPVDWETAAFGPGLVDLAALTAGRWTDSERIELAMAYHAAYPPADGWPPEPDEFLAALDVCRLHLAVQWLGWARDWSPPPDHAHDWLAEAVALADKLGP